MRLVAMVSFWDETPELMENCMDGLYRLGVTHVVAVDGVLDLYPGGEPNSNLELHAHLIDVASWYSMDLLLYRNQKRWAGNEVGKRQAMLKLALSITTDQDWLLIWDTDYVLLEDLGEPIVVEDSPIVYPYLHDWLGQTGLLNFADVSYGENPDHLYKARLLMRARRGLHLTTNHYIYHGPNGEQSWFLGMGDEHQALQLRQVRVYHNRELRPPERVEGRRVFYERRDELGVEWR